MSTIKRLTLLIIVMFTATFAHALCTTLENVGNQLTPAHHAYGRTITKDDLHGRVVIVWNISEFISAEDEDNNDNNHYRNKRNKDDDEDDDNSIKGIEKSIRKAAKGAIKDGRLCVIAVCKRPENSIIEKRMVKNIRKKKPYFPVYFINASTELFNTRGISVNTAGIKVIAESEHLTNALEEAPDYLPGRIILIKSKHHANLCNRFVIGKNIEQPLDQLRKAANGNNEKADEAKLLLAEVQTYLDETKAQIESNLTSAPALALTQLMTLRKTAPSTVRPLAKTAAQLSKSKEITFMTSIYKFLKEANLGEYGSGDLGRNSDAFVKRLTALKASKDTAIATEATALIDALTPYTTAAIEAAENAERESLKRTKLADKEREDALDESRDRRDKRSKDNKPASEQISALKALSAYTSVESLAPLENELEGDIRTCNFENLRNAFTTISQQSSARGTAAKAALDAINSYAQAKDEALKNIIANGLLLDLHDEEADWEDVITVNFPSMQRTPHGSAALKAIRDSEVRKIYVAYNDAKNGTPKRQENDSNRRNNRHNNDNESAEDYAVKTTQYKISKHQSLLKYLNTRSTFGKACVAQLANMGYSAKDIEATIESLKTEMKEQKKAAKDAEKQRRENERNRD